MKGSQLTAGHSYLNNNSANAAELLMIMWAVVGGRGKASTAGVTFPMQNFPIYSLTKMYRPWFGCFGRRRAQPRKLI